MRSVEEDVKALQKAMDLIIFGLDEKIRIKEPYKYPYSSKCRHGMNMYYRLALSYDKTFDLSKAYETYFIVNYAAKPVNEWFETWDKEFVEKIKNANYFQSSPLVNLLEGNRFEMTEFSKKYLENLDIE